LLKFASAQTKMADGAQIKKRSNSDEDCSILLKLCTEFDHVTADTLKTFKVKRSKVNVTTP